jgi:hypothetical protein
MKLHTPPVLSTRAWPGSWSSKRGLRAVPPGGGRGGEAGSGGSVNWAFVPPMLQPTSIDVSTLATPRTALSLTTYLLCLVERLSSPYSPLLTPHHYSPMKPGVSARREQAKATKTTRERRSSRVRPTARDPRTNAGRSLTHPASAREIVALDPSCHLRDPGVEVLPTVEELPTKDSTLFVRIVLALLMGAGTLIRFHGVRSARCATRRRAGLLPDCRGTHS